MAVSTDDRVSAGNLLEAARESGGMVWYAGRVKDGLMGMAWHVLLERNPRGAIELWSNGLMFDVVRPTTEVYGRVDAR